MVSKIRRIFIQNKLTSWFLFLILILNISLPPSLNFFREILIFSQSLKFNFYLIYFILILFLISGLISIILILKMFINKEKNIIYFLCFPFSFFLNFNFLFFFIILIIFNIKIF